MPMTLVTNLNLISEWFYSEIHFLGSTFGKTNEHNILFFDIGMVIEWAGGLDFVFVSHYLIMY